MNINLFVANPLPQGTGYTWTLASRLGHMLEEVQNLYGERDKSYTVLGFEFINGVPKIWFPGNCKNIIIQLGIECMKDEPQAMFQLAHECIHLLSPIGQRGANYLEEGLASYYSKKFIKDNYNFDMNTNNEKYNAARCLVEKLLNNNSNAIKSIRSINPNIKEIEFEDIMQCVKMIDIKDAEALVDIF